MKILHLIPSLKGGGAEKQLSLLVKLLAKSDIESHIGFYNDGHNLVDLQDELIKLHRIKSHGNYDPMNIWRVIKLIKEIKPDIVQTWITHMDIVGGIASILTKTPFIISERSSGEAYGQGWKIFLRIKISSKASRIIANSKGGADYWQSLSLSTPIFHVGNIINIDKETSPSLTENNFPGDLILFAGRLNSIKNVELILDAFIAVSRQRKDVVFRIFGEGPEYAKLELRIQEYQVNNRVLLQGFTTNLAGWMNRADILVSASHFEGSPNVVLEGGMNECALILSDIPAHRAIYDESSAWFFNHRSVDALKNALLIAINNKNESIIKAKNARKAVEIISKEKISEKYIYHYLSVINENS